MICKLTFFNKLEAFAWQVEALAAAAVWFSFVPSHAARAWGVRLQPESLEVSKDILLSLFLAREMFRSRSNKAFSKLWDYNSNP